MVHKRSLYGVIAASPFVQTYYALHCILILSWILVRIPLAQSGSEKIASTLTYWERHAGATTAIAIVVKLYRAQTVEAFLAETFFYAEMAVVLLAWMLDARILCWYLIAIGTLYLLCRPPLHRRIERMREFPLSGLADALSKKGSWVVMFYAQWSPASLHFSRLFTDLAHRYDSPGLKFGRVDVGRWPVVPLFYSIEDSLVGSQLPTLVLYVDGGEVARLSPQHSWWRPSSTLKKAHIVREFELDRRCIQGRRP